MTDLDTEIADCPFCDVSVNLEEGGCEHFVSPEDEDAFNGAYWKLFPFAEDAAERCERDIAHDLLEEVQGDEAKKLTQLSSYPTYPIECLAGYDPINNGEGGFYSENRVAFRRLCELMDTVAKSRDDKVKNILEDYRRFQNAWYQLYERFWEFLKEGGDKHSLWSYFCSFAPNKSFEKELQSVGSPADRDACAAIFRLFQSRGGHRDKGWDSLQDFESHGVLALNHPEKIPEVTNILCDLITNEAEAYKAAQSKKAKAAAKNNRKSRPTKRTSDRRSISGSGTPPPDSGEFLTDVPKPPQKPADQVEALERENRTIKKSVANLRAKTVQLESELQRVRAALETQRSKARALRDEIAEERGRILAHCPNAQYWLISLCDPAERPLDWSEAVVTLGRDPIDDDFFDELLERGGFTAVEPGCADAEVMIVGREACDITQVRRQISARRGQSIRVYSQEMAFLALATGCDPFDAPQDTLEEMGQSHPVLSLLITDPFEWPALRRHRSAERAVIEISKWNPLSPLTAMGYHTGKEFRNSKSRRDRLSDIVEGRLVFPEGFGAERKNEWGTPGSRQRILKVAMQLVQNISLPGQSPFLGLAADHWQSDYEWLKKQYPKGGSGGWPTF